MKVGRIQPNLKLAFIIPQLKSGSSRNEPSSWRPISQTSQLIKTYERAIKKSMQAFLEDNSLLNNFQYGFRQNRSCLSQLLAFYNTVLNETEEGNIMDAIYLDFQKAFDVVDIGLLCHRMRDKGISGSLGVWLHNFLTSRKQQVLVNNSLSGLSDVTSGVPQGTVLGPLLFLILIDSMGELEINSLLLAFADDSKIVTKVSSEADIHNMQAHMETIYDWQASNNMKFNFGKFNPFYPICSKMYMLIPELTAVSLFFVHSFGLLEITCYHLIDLSNFFRSISIIILRSGGQCLGPCRDEKNHPQSQVRKDEFYMTFM